MNIDFYHKFQNTIKKMEEVGIAYSEAKGQSWQKQELKGAVLSKIMQGLGEMSQSKAEITAKGTPDYASYLQDTSEAITKELKLKCEYEKWKCSFEALRSLSSLEKVTQNLTGE